MKTKHLITLSIIGVAGIVLADSCASIPKGAAAVKNFDVKRYLGTWYEIARMDFRFERNLNNTTANYTLNPDGTIRVVNRGFNYITKEWKQAVGKAKFRGNPDEAKLKVSFFGPFYSGYNVIALDNEYRYALVAGKDLKYLWILSRDTGIPDNIRQKYLGIAKKIGYKTEKLIWVKHDKE